MESKNEYLVLGANKYNFEQGGDTVKGATVRYLSFNNAVEDKNAVGIRPIEIKTSFENASFFDAGTGIYAMSFAIVPGAKGAPKMVLTSARLVKKVDLQKLLASA